jgi:hypothetical protein
MELTAFWLPFIAALVRLENVIASQVNLRTFLSCPNVKNFSKTPRLPSLLRCASCLSVSRPVNFKLLELETVVNS